MKKGQWIRFIPALGLLVSVLLGCNLTRSATSDSGSKSENQNHSAPSSTSSSKRTDTAPPNIAGNYSVSGTNPGNTGSYRGTLEVIARGGVYQFRWNAGTQYDGVGVQLGDVVAVAFANGGNGKGCGVIDYNIQSNGTLDGKWGYWGTNEAGTETAMRTSGSGLEGEYDATGKNPDGKQYKAKLTVEPAGNLYRFVWSNNTDGVGIKQGDNIAVGIGGSRCGFVVYQVKSNGTLDGVWGGGGSDNTGTEIATKQ
jgi:hypothetical protein